MNATSITTLIGLAAAGAAPFVLEPRAGFGALAGFLAGATVAGLALLAARRVAVRKPQYVIHMLLAGFLGKAALLLALTLTVRFVPALAETLDAVAFLLGYAAAILLVLAPGTLDVLSALGAKTGAKTGPTRAQPAPGAEARVA